MDLKSTDSNCEFCSTNLKLTSDDTVTVKSGTTLKFYEYYAIEKSVSSVSDDITLDCDDTSFFASFYVRLNK